MKKKIYLNMCKITFIAIFLSFVLSSVLYYQKAEQQMKREVSAEVGYIEAAVELSGLDYFSHLSNRVEGKLQNRITMIAADGTVLFDNYMDSRSMENHLDRPEVAEALQDGHGERIRTSDTFSEKTYYYAVRIEDGNIIRGSATIRSVLASVYDLLPWMLLVGVIAGVLSMIAADFQTKRIIRPFNEIDLDHPQQDDLYEELVPFMRKIQGQQQMIKDQIALLQEKKKEFQTITDHMQEGFLVIDKEEKVISYNISALRILGIEHEAADLTGSHILRFYRNSRLCSMVELAVTGTHVEEAMEIGERTYQMIANPVRQGADYHGVILIILDITEKHNREAFRREFSANVSHELKTPLTSILGYAELMKNGLVRPEDNLRFSENIYKEANRMKKLVEDIIQLSRLDEQLTGAAEEEVDLYEVAKEVVWRRQEQAEGRNITITLDGESAKVIGVRQILQEMIDNLCDNAIKYNKENGTVTITVSQEPEQVILQVSDTGIGVADGEQERIFERFYRSDKSHSKTIEGTGLGLSIVKRGALYHHADIELLSEEGVGTTVKITFPYKS